MKRDAEKINDELFYTMLLRNASPALYEMGEAKLVCGIIAGALADADWYAYPQPKGVEASRRWRQKVGERNEARKYLTSTGGMLDYHAGLVGLDPQFVREQVAVIRRWAQPRGEKIMSLAGWIPTVFHRQASQASKPPELTKPGKPWRKFKFKRQALAGCVEGVIEQEVEAASFAHFHAILNDLNRRDQGRYQYWAD